MVEIAQIVEAIRAGRIRITDHADEEAQADDLTLDDVLFSAKHGEIIENYPTDQPFPSCLIFGRTVNDEPVHSVWAYNRASGWAVMVTVYRPDPDRWVDWRRRKERS